MPEFDVKPPKTLRGDLENYLADRAKLNRWRERGVLTADEYDCAARDLERIYADRIHREDCYTFEDEQEFGAFLNFLKPRRPQDAEALEQAYTHEREHFEAIRGDPRVVSARYCMWLLQEDDETTSVFPAVEVRGQTGDDYLGLRGKSIGAVTEPSPLDEFEVGEVEHD